MTEKIYVYFNLYFFFCFSFKKINIIVIREKKEKIHNVYFPKPQNSKKKRINYQINDLSHLLPLVVWDFFYLAVKICWRIYFSHIYIWVVKWYINLWNKLKIMWYFILFYYILKKLPNMIRGYFNASWSSFIFDLPTNAWAT